MDHGRNGLCVARNAEVEYRTERGNVSPLNVHMLIPDITNVMEPAMKRRNAMKIVAQVCLNLP